MDGSAALEGIEEESKEEVVSLQPESFAGILEYSVALTGLCWASTKEVPVLTANCAPKNAFGSPSRASLGEIVSYRPEGCAHALPDDSALGGLPNKLQRGPVEIKRPAPTVARRVVLVLPWQVPGLGIVRSQDSTERSWFKVSRFCYTLMKYSWDRQSPAGAPGRLSAPAS